jgi:hypothetical protein
MDLLVSVEQYTDIENRLLLECLLLVLRSERNFWGRRA